MTSKESGTLLDYIRMIADRMCLRDWEFILCDEPSPPTCWAQILRLKGRRVAEIQVCNQFRTIGPNIQRHAIVHELIHCHFASADHVIEIDLGKHPALNDHEHDFIFTTYMREMEYGVDGMTKALAQFLPFIEWGESES